jgi:hypothetical protein
MATGPASAILAALKTKAAAAVIAGAVVVGGGATAVAVTTGAVHLPGQTTTAAQQGDQHSGDTKDGSDARAQACATNGDAQKLAATYKAMFGGSAKDAQVAICQVFVNANGGHAVGLGDIRQALDLAAWIESKGGATACLTSSPAHGDSSDTSGSTGGNGSSAGNAGDHGKSGDHGSGNNGSGGSTDSHGQATLTIPSASTATTEAVLKAIFAAEQSGRPIAQMAQACGAPHGVGDGGSDGSGTGSQGGGDGHGNGGGVKPGPTPAGPPEVRP